MTPAPPWTGSESLETNFLLLVDLTTLVFSDCFRGYMLNNQNTEMSFQSQGYGHTSY